MLSLSFIIGISNAAIFLMIGALFCCLTVTIADRIIVISFGPGIIRKRYSLNDVKVCREVRNSLLYGWGLRKIKDGWLYNVSGLRAVALTMKDGREIRIGTDEPGKLKKTIDGLLEQCISDVQF